MSKKCALRMRQVASNLTPGIHEIAVVKRTEPYYGNNIVSGDIILSMQQQLHQACRAESQTTEMSAQE
jgi:hypothetical protein